MTKVEFRHRLREAMEMNGLKQADLASKGFDKGQISAWLSGKYKPKQSNIDKLSQIFGVSEAWLMGFDAPMERFPSDDAEHFNVTVADFNKKRNDKIIEMKLSDSELDMIRRYRELDDYGKDAVDSLLKTEFERCTDSDNVIHLSKEILEQLPMSIRLPLLQYQDEEYELRVARKNRRESK